jgi:hypothetical protein
MTRVLAQRTAGFAAQQESLETSLVKVCAATLSALKMVRYGLNRVARWWTVMPADSAGRQPASSLAGFGPGVYA